MVHPHNSHIFSLSSPSEESCLHLGLLPKALGAHKIHFRFEEEAPYPMFKRFLGEYVVRPADDHNGAINMAKAVAELLKNDSLKG